MSHTSLIQRMLAGPIALAIGLAVACTSFAASSLRVWGEPGEPVTGGGVLWFDSTSTFRFEQRLGGLACSIGLPVFSLEFRGSALHPLATGSYGPLLALPNDNESTMLEVYQGRGCRSVSGSFQVRKLALMPDGTLRQAWITWTTQCLANLPRQSGDLRVNADTTLWQDLPADQWCTAGDSAKFEVRAFHAGGRPVTFQVADLPAGASFIDLGGGQARFRWKTTLLHAGRVVPVTVIASDDQGVRDTSVTRVRVVPYARLAVASDPGDPIGGGRTFEMSGPETAVQLTEQQSNIGLQATWLKGAERLHFAFVAPFARRLEPGVYEGATRAPFQASMAPGLDVNGLFSCNKESGRFTIRRLTRDPQGAVTGIWATVEDHCENAAPALRSEMRYNIDTTLFVQAPADVNVEVGQPVSFTANAIGTLGRPMQLQVIGLPTGATFTPSGAGAGTFSWLAPQDPIAEVAVHFVGTDDQTGHQEVVTRIHVSRPSRFYLRSTVGDCNLPGQSLVFTQLGSDFNPLPRDSSEAWVRVANGNLNTGVNLRSPFGTALRKGTFPVGRYDYTGADRILGYMTYTVGGFFYYNNGGDFHVRKWRTDSNGFTRSLWATWQAGCGTSITTTGQIIFNADTSLYLTAPGIARVERGRMLQMDISGTSVTGAPVTLRCTQSPAGAEFTPAGAGRATFTWNASVPAGDAVATFIGSQTDGNADTLSTLIRVLRPQLMVVNAYPGHYLADGGAHRLDATNSNFDAPEPDATALWCYAMGRTWTFRANAPHGRRMTPGMYVGARGGSGGISGREPTLQVSSGLYGAYGDSVAFHVRKVAFDATGRLMQLWMPFVTREYEAHYVTGELRFGDPDTTLYMNVPADVYADPTSALSFGIQAVHASGRPMRLTARGLPGTANLVDAGDGTGTFAWTVNAPAGSTLPITWVATDDQGVQDTSVTIVHVVVPATLQTVRNGTDPFDSWAESSSTDATRAAFTLYPLGEHGAALQVQSGNRDWLFHFGTPYDARFVPGTYTRAVNLNDWTGSEALLGIYLNGETCQFGASGTFTVLDASYDESGHLATFAATFKDSCDSRPTLSGEVRYGVRLGVVATLASRLIADGEGGLARLAWRVASTGGSLRLERRMPGAGQWLEIAARAPDGLGEVSFEDRDVVVGETYEYRLASMSGVVLDQVSIAISAVSPFRILSVGPNPVHRTLVLMMAGRQDGPLRLSVLDVAGRVVWSDVLPAASTASSTIDMHLPAGLAQGVYILRASTARWSANHRFALVQ